MKRRSIFHVGSLLALGAVAACAGGATLPRTAPGGGSSGAGAAKVSIVISIPHRSPLGSRARRAPRFVSPSTKSLSIAFTPNGSGVATSASFNVTSASNGCSTAAGKTTCTESVSVAPGNYTATVNTYDGDDESGKLLSHGQNLPAKIEAGQANTIALVIGGVPHALSLSGSGSVHGSSASGFTVYGSGAVSLIVTAKDADGNTIVGAGTPYAGTFTSGSGWAIATPKPASPNTFTLTPPGTNGNAATLKISVNYDAATCAISGVVCHVSFGVTNRIQYLFVEDCEVSCFNSMNPDAVKVYAAPYTGAAIATITKGVLDPQGLAVDAQGDLFVANCGASCAGSGSDTVTEYAPPYTSNPLHTISVTAPFALAVNAAGDLFVENASAIPNTISEFSPPYTGSATTLNFSGQVDAMAVDPDGDLMAVTCRTTCGYSGADAVLQFASPYTGMPSAITNGIAASGSIPTGLGFDSSGNMFVSNCASCNAAKSFSVTEYAKPYSGAPIATITGSGAGAVSTPLSLVVDSSDNLLVGNGPNAMSSTISKFAAPSYSGAGTVFLAGYQPYEMQIDGLDDLFLSDGDTVEISSPPYSSKTTLVSEGLGTNIPFVVGP